MSKIVLALDSHMLSLFQDCEREFQLGAIRSLESSKKRPALSKGTLIHDILAEYYHRIQLINFENFDFGENKQGVVQDIVTRIIQREDTELEFEDLSLIAQRFAEYTNYYVNDWTPIKVEGYDNTGFSKIIHETDKVKFIYEGRIDLLAIVGGKFNRWVDHKSQSPRYPFNRFQNVNQFIGYTWASGFQGIINYITWSAKVTDKTFRRQDLLITPQFVNKWVESTIEWYYKILHSIKKSNYPYNFSACETKYGPCQFHKICGSTNKIAEEYIIKSDFVKRERWKAW